MPYASDTRTSVRELIEGFARAPLEGLGKLCRGLPSGLCTPRLGNLNERFWQSSCHNKQNSDGYAGAATLRTDWGSLSPLQNSHAQRKRTSIYRVAISKDTSTAKARYQQCSSLHPEILTGSLETETGLGTVLSFCLGGPQKKKKTRIARDPTTIADATVPKSHATTRDYEE